MRGRGVDCVRRDRGRPPHAPGDRLRSTPVRVPRALWQEHIDPAQRGDAIRFVDDALGHARVMWRDHVLSVADVQTPGETDAIGERRRRERSGAPPLARYDESLPRDYWDPAARRESSPRSASTRPCCSRTTASSGSARCRRTARADREHGGVEPLVRDGGAGRPGAAAPGGAPDAARPRVARGDSSRASPRPACARR